MRKVVEWISDHQMTSGSRFTRLLFYRKNFGAQFRLTVSIKVTMPLNVLLPLKLQPSSSIPNASLKVVAQFDTGVRVVPLS